MTLHTAAFKKKLLEEKQLVEKELSTVARRNPENPKDWEPVSSDRNGAPPDRDEAAEKIESFEATLTQLLKPFVNVSMSEAALRNKAG